MEKKMSPRNLDNIVTIMFKFLIFFALFSLTIDLTMLTYFAPIKIDKNVYYDFLIFFLNVIIYAIFW